MNTENYSSATALNKIGERIRLLRQKKGLTQSELAGNDVTRNMLSRIEHGAALPSLGTLCSLADRLGVPPGALLTDLSEYSKAELERRLTALFKEGNFDGIFKTCEEYDIRLMTKEAYSTVCRAYIGRAQKYYDIGKLSDATADTQKAQELLPLCHESDEKELNEKLYLIKGLISSCSVLYPDDNAVVEEGAKERLRSIIYKSCDAAIYLYALAKLYGLTHSAYSVPIDEAPSLRAELLPMAEGLSDSVYKTHIEAKLDLINADYLGAKAKLITTLTPEPAPAILYDVYRDLEFCCKCCGDFENAYKYSGLRLELAKRLS